ncbi:MAG: MoxR family ATPase [Planctomycetota bacterium]
MSRPPLAQRAAELAEKVHALERGLQRRILGQEALISDLVLGILAGGHLLLEGLPGLGKTMLVRALARGLGLGFSRVQFTPDLMPSDVTGTQIIEENQGRRSFRFQKGPIFASLVLADEINRATPKTQSAMLEAMQEHSVTVAGTSHAMPEPFHVVATQNPIELEGTFPLPEAQLDRFLFKLLVSPPDTAAMVSILDGTTGEGLEEPEAVFDPPEVLELQGLVRTILCGTHLLRFVAELLRETHPHLSGGERTARFVRYGASARAGQAIVLGAKARALLRGRAAVVEEDIAHCLLPALRHRVVLGFEAEAEDVGVKELLPEWSERAAKRAAKA